MDNYLVTALIAGVISLGAAYALVRNTVRFLREGRQERASMELATSNASSARTISAAPAAKPSGNAQAMSTTAASSSSKVIQPRWADQKPEAKVMPSAADKKPAEATTTAAVSTPEAKAEVKPTPEVKPEPPKEEAVKANGEAKVKPEIKPAEKPEAKQDKEPAAKPEAKEEAKAATAPEPAATGTAQRPAVAVQGPNEEDKKEIANVEQILSKYFDDGSGKG